MDRKQTIVMAMGAAHRAHKQFGIDPRTRIDVFGALRRVGACVFFRPLKSMFGAYVPTGKASPGLLINSNLPLSVQRYTAAHELGHLFLKHKTVSFDTNLGYLPEERNGLDEEENQAEAFAAFFLMPKALVVNSLRDLKVHAQNLRPPDVYLLALNIGSSYLATVNQLQTLKLISHPAASSLRNLQPKQIKQELNENESLGRHDIWVVNEHWNGKEIFPAPQDTIRIQLQEIPTSGYTWLPREVATGVQFMEDTYKGDDNSDEIGGVQVHEFVAQLQENAQDSTLVLEKKRSWDEESAAADFSIDIRPQHLRRTGPLVLPKLA
jgi:Zn-dependent peptidase ImmA (M78 family)